MRLLFIFLLFSSFSLKAQNFFQIDWTGYDEIDYKAFLVYNNSDEILVRVGYNSKDGAYKVAKYTCTRKSYYDENGKKNILFDGKNAEVVFSSKKENTSGYNADNFTFYNVNESNNFEKLYTIDDSQVEETNPRRKEAKLKQLNPEVDFTSTFLKRFFFSTEPLYKKLVISETGTKVTAPITQLVSKVRLIAIGNTQDENLGTAVEKDIKSYRYFLKNLSKNMNIPFEETILIDDDFDKNVMLSKVNNLNINDDEVVVFLYRGHGFRWADQKSDFPRMNFSAGFDTESYGIETLYNKIISDYSPRLLIAIGDLCNNQEGLTPGNLGNGESTFAQDNPSTSMLDIKKAEKLMSSRGSFLIVSASPGEVSYANERYGFFSKSFIDAFKWEMSKLNENTFVSWRTIINTSKKKAREKSVDERRPAQNALYKFNIK